MDGNDSEVAQQPPNGYTHFKDVGTLPAWNSSSFITSRGQTGIPDARDVGLREAQIVLKASR